MKKIIVPVLLLCLLLTACVQGSPREQLQNMQQTTAASTTSSSMTVVMTTVPTTAPTTIPTTAPTTSTKPTTSSTVSTTMPTTVSTAPTTVTTAPTTASTTQPTTSTKPTTNTTKPTTNTTKPTTITTIPTSSITQAEDGLLYKGNQIKVYEENGKYSFVILVGGLVEFSLDRVVVRTHLIEPIQCDNYQELLNYSFDDIKSMFGEPHFEEGSGMYIPSYITEDAYIIRLYPQHDGSIESVVLFDPIQNEIIEIWNIYTE